MTINDAEYQFLSLFVEGDGTIQDKRYAFYTGVLDGSISMGGIDTGTVPGRVLQADGNGGIVIQYVLSHTPNQNSAALRGPGGQLRVGTAVLEDAAVTKAQLDAAVIAEGGELKGTGSPLGVVSAPVGTYYTDIAGTNGAWRWLKTSGTGNTGWTVTAGKTGYRKIELINGWDHGAVGPFLVRSNDTVYLACYNVGPTNRTDLTAYQLPLGFRPARGTQVFQSVGGGAVSIQLNGNVLPYTSANTFIGGLNFISWDTNDPWPTTLPGIPA